MSLLLKYQLTVFGFCNGGLGLILAILDDPYAADLHWSLTQLQGVPQVCYSWNQFGRHSSSDRQSTLINDTVDYGHCLVIIWHGLRETVDFGRIENHRGIEEI